MRTVFLLWRMQVLARERAGETEPPPLMSVKQVVEIATLGGARVNQLEKKTGSLTPGKEADLIMLATDRINVMPLNNAYAAVVQGMDTSNVDTVFVGGKVKKRRAHPPDGQRAATGSFARSGPAASAAASVASARAWSPARRSKPARIASARVFPGFSASERAVR